VVGHDLTENFLIRVDNYGNPMGFLAADGVGSDSGAGTLDPLGGENTVRTTLTRLVDKGALTTAKNEAGTRTFGPLV